MLPDPHRVGGPACQDGKMRARTTLALGGAALAWLLPADGAAAVCKYKIEVLQPSMAGYDYCWVSALNDVGQVTGTCTQDPGEEKRAYLYRGGVTVDVGVLSGFNQGYGLGLNNRGHVVGYSTLSFDPAWFDAHLYRGGPLISATFPSGRHAVRWDGPTTMVDLGTLPGGAFSEARGIADNGTMAGVASTSAGLRGFFYSPAQVGLQAIGTFGGSTSSAAAVSSKGLVVGYAHDSLQNWRGFVWRKGRLYQLNALLDGNTGRDPWNVVSALDINEKGQILALAYTTSSTGYVLLHPNDCTVSSSNACCPF